MQNITFALPTLATSAMTAADQGNTLVNQATAVIVAEYLGHMNAAIEKGIFSSPTGTPFLTQSELVSLINNVQTALRSS